MNGVSRLLSLALLGAALHWAPAQAEEQPRLFELLGQPGYKATWHAMFKGESDVPKWVSDASGPSSPSTSLSLEGQPYVLANSCKPHDCGNNRLLVAFRGDKSRLRAAGEPAGRARRSHADAEQVRHLSLVRRTLQAGPRAADETVGERSELEVTPGLRVTRPGGGEGG